MRNLFELAVKIAGLVVLLQGLRNIIESVLIVLLFEGLEGLSNSPKYWAAWAFFKIVAGVYLMVGARPVVKLAFLSAQDDADARMTFSDIGRIMEPRVVFGLIVKTVGLLVFLGGLEFFIDSLLTTMMSSKEPMATNQRWFLSSILEMLVGLALLRGLVPLVDFAFPGRPSADERQPEKRDAGHDNQPE